MRLVHRTAPGLPARCTKTGFRRKSTPWRWCRDGVLEQARGRPTSLLFLFLPSSPRMLLIDGQAGWKPEGLCVLFGVWMLSWGLLPTPTQLTLYPPERPVPLLVGARTEQVTVTLRFRTTARVRAISMLMPRLLFDSRDTLVRRAAIYPQKGGVSCGVIRGSLDSRRVPPWGGLAP